jgi:hypothetical protein
MRDAGNLELDQDLVFQRREWAVQRFGWWVLTAFVAAAVLGLFGGGPLSTAQAAAADGSLAVEYERFVRVGASTRIAVRAKAPAPASDVHLRIRRSYFETLRVDRIVPEPHAVAIGEEDVSLRFRSEGSAGPFTVILDVQPLRVGPHRPAIGLNGHASVTFVQFAYF